MSKRNGAATGGPVKADENENVAAYRAKSGGLLLQVNTEEVKPYFVKLSFSSNDVSWTKSSSDCLIESVWLQDRPAIKNIPNAHPPGNSNHLRDKLSNGSRGGIFTAIEQQCDCVWNIFFPLQLNNNITVSEKKSLSEMG